MGKRNFKEKLAGIIFEADTFSGKLYDILLIITVFASVLAVMLDSVASINKIYGRALSNLEWFFTALFTIDYITRLAVVKKPAHYAKSFFGIVDLLGVIPTYLGLIFPGTRFLITIRFLRILRLFRILKLATYMEEVRQLSLIMRKSLRKITVFLFFVLVLIVVLGSLMYVIEGPEHGFTSIPVSIYWAIVTLTTVGYGDISPQTALGQALASLIMILGYSIIVIPTGIVTVDIAGSGNKKPEACPKCGERLR